LPDSSNLLSKLSSAVQAFNSAQIVEPSVAPQGPPRIPQMEMPVMHQFPFGIAPQPQAMPMPQPMDFPRPSYQGTIFSLYLLITRCF
jgi:hypothetical protein